MLWRNAGLGLLAVVIATGCATWTQTGSVEPSVALRKLDLPAQFVTSLAADAAGGCWVGTEGQGVFHVTADLRQDQHFSVPQGLGDSNIYAVAVDRLGRVWAGTLNHGVAVFNGKSWRAYGIKDGPLGERVFAIACCPTDGDVWMATSAGLARYSMSKEEWSYFTKWDSLPADQARSIAFDAQGNIHVGFQCDGVALAQAAQQYQTWQTVTVPWYRDPRCHVPFPTVPTGPDLPCNFINQLGLTRNGLLWAATTEGLAWSLDHGQTWRHIRGQDFAARVKGLWGGPPAGWQPPDAATQETLLPADHVTAVAETLTGRLWVGSRDHGCALFDPSSQAVVQRVVPDKNGLKDGYISALLALPGGRVVAGSYGGGVWLLQDAPAPSGWHWPALFAHTPPLPRQATVPGAATLRALTAKLQTLQTPLAPGSAVYLGEDWATQGDWCERYGSRLAVLCGAMQWNLQVVCDHDYSTDQFVGPNAHAQEGPCTWIQWLRCDDNASSLYLPDHGIRREAELNDSSFRYPATQDGPDLWLEVNVPAGGSLVSLYFHNKDGHTGKNRLRDYWIEVRHSTGKKSRAELFGLDATATTNTPADCLCNPVLAHARVCDFWNGVYKTFYVQGPGPFLIRIVRHGSHVTTLAGIMLDKFPAHYADPQRESLARHNYGGVLYNPPDVQSITPESAPELADTLNLWHAAESVCANVGGAASVRTTRTLAYRSLANMPPDSSLLANWRWYLRSWDEAEHTRFWEAMMKSWDQKQRQNIALQSAKFRQYSPHVVPLAVEELRRLESQGKTWDEIRAQYPTKPPPFKLQP